MYGKKPIAPGQPISKPRPIDKPVATEGGPRAKLPTRPVRTTPVGGKDLLDRGFGRGKTAPGGKDLLDRGFGQRRPAPAGGITKLPAPAGSKGMPGKTQGVVNRDAAKRAAIKRVMGPRG